jgi:hypothetical protein
MDTYAAMIQDIVTQHYGDILLASNDACSNCQSPKPKAEFLAVSWLDRVSSPSVLFFCEPACNTTACETIIRGKIRASIAAMVAMEGEASPVGEGQVI